MGKWGQKARDNIEKRRQLATIPVLLLKGLREKFRSGVITCNIPPPFEAPANRKSYIKVEFSNSEDAIAFAVALKAACN